MKSVISLFSVLALLILTLVGCSGNYTTHTLGEISIELPKQYERYADAEELFDLSLTDGRAIIGLNRISFTDAIESGLDITRTPRDFAEYYMESADVDSEVLVKGDVPYYTYTYDRLDVNYYCMIAFYRTPYAYHIATLMVKNEYKIEYENAFVDYIDNVTMKLEEIK